MINVNLVTSVKNIILLIIDVYKNKLKINAIKIL